MATTWPRISVIILTLNEARNLPAVILSLPPGIFEVVLVDGHSTDGTVEVARRLCPEVRVILQDGKGKGTALCQGIAACRGEIIVTMDADGSTDGREIPRFVQALMRGAEFAKGSRFVAGGGSADLTMLRRMGNWALTLLVNRLFRLHYTDLCYGYNAFWAHRLPDLGPACAGFEIETLLNIRIARAGSTVEEVPSFEHPRIHGCSKLYPVRDGLRILGVIIHERRAGLRLNRPNSAFDIGQWLATRGEPLPAIVGGEAP